MRNEIRTEYRQDVKLAPPGELKAYVVYEHQIDSLSQGAPTALLLNFAIFFIGVAISTFGRLVALPQPPQPASVVPPESGVTVLSNDRVYYTFVILCAISGIAGAVPGAIWFTMHRSTASLVAEIKAQMPPNPAIEQGPIAQPFTNPGELHTSS